MPLLSVVIPAYNARASLDRAIADLTVVEGIEVLVVNDGSVDDTGAIADGWATRFPAVVRVIHQPNRGHGGAINAGIDAAQGEFIKVLDADDWLDLPSLRRLIAALASVSDDVDAVFTDFVHERLGKRPKTARFDSVFPGDGEFGWEHTRKFGRRQILMMHAIVYRTRVVRACNLRLPERTFYVDSLYVVLPLAEVRRMVYLPLPLYRYAIGRAGQSVAARTMVDRVDQQLRVNRLALAALPHAASVAHGSVPVELQRALVHYVQGVCAVTSATLVRGGTAQHLAQRAEFWRELRDRNPALYRQMRRSVIGTTSNLPGAAGRRATSIAYSVARRVVGFS